MMCLVVKEETIQEGNNNSSMPISNKPTMHKMLNNRMQLLSFQPIINSMHQCINMLRLFPQINKRL